MKPTRRNPATLALALTAVVAVGARAAEEPQAAPAAAEQTQQVMAGRPEYDESSFYRKTFGDGYRSLWTTPFTVPVLKLDSYAGGLTPVRQVGSMQSIGLALKGADGKSYTFRTLDKDPRKILPPEWRDSLPAYIFQDQTTASHPGTAYIVPPLAEAAGVPHTDPKVVFMPDDPALGTFREVFGGHPGTIDEYPTAADGGQPGFHQATEILSTAQLWESWLKGTGWVDPQALLRARMFDLFLSDWDRHNGQWRWMRLPGHQGLVAFPEDRDQALSHYSGFLMRMARQAAPRLLSWRQDYANMNGLLFQGREIDDWLLTGVERPAFVEMARDVQGRLTDAVIEQAVHRLPPEWYALGGDALIAGLKKRRDLLPKGAEAFYENLARYVDVQGTDRDDVASLTREADGSALLELSVAGEATPYFRRRFLPKETSEVRVYLQGGSDRFTSTGPRGGVKVRLSGGAGADRLDDSASGGTSFYDVDAPTEVVKGPGTGVSTREWTRVPYKKETPWMEKRDFGSLRMYQPLLWWEPDPGVVLAFNVMQYRYGFRKQPYASMQHLGVEYKAKRNAFAVNYGADFRWSRPGFGTYVEAYADGAENYNFFGFGNETFNDEDLNDDDFYEAHQKVFYAFPSLIGHENARRTYWFALGPQVKYGQNGAPDNTFIASAQPYGFGDFGAAGARLTLEVDTRGRRLVGMQTAGLAPGSGRKVTGLKLELNGHVYPKGWDVRETFEIASAAMTGYWQVASQVTLAGRVGGQKNWGEYPWHESAFLGGSDTVRGYERNRFAGDSSFYANSQLMVSLFNLNLILPLRVGVLGLADAGRVWVQGESSDKWHPAYGGGIFVRILTTEAVFHALLAQGDEGLRFYVNFGYGI